VLPGPETLLMGTGTTVRVIRTVRVLAVVGRRPRRGGCSGLPRVCPLFPERLVTLFRLHMTLVQYS
jgi:hypothetical protein